MMFVRVYVYLEGREIMIDNGAKWICKGVIIMMDDGIKIKSHDK